MAKWTLKEVVIHEGHGYREHYSNAQYRLLYCTERRGTTKCEGAIKISTSGIIEVVKGHAEHTESNAEVKRARWCLKKVAGRQKEKRAQSVIREVAKVVGEECLTSMGTKNAVRGVIRRARRDEECRKNNEQESKKDEEEDNDE